MSDHTAALASSFGLLICVVFAVGGCEQAGYLSEQARGQLRLLDRRQRIVDMLRRPDLPAERRTKLELVLRARRYAFDEIGLRETGAYTMFYETGGKPIATNVSAAKKDQLRPKTWSFPIVGAVPYLGFFSPARARALDRRLRAKGLDTYVRPVSAFSSLGWFKDPLYASMLDAPPWSLVEVVLHETTHTTIFLRGQVGFNESLAVFVGQQGTLDFFARLLGPGAPLVRTAQRAFLARRRFARLVEQLYQRLQRLYALPISRADKLRRREPLFAWAKRRYVEIFPGKTDAGFVQRPLNNAVVLSHGRYLQGLRFHQAVYRCVDRRLDRFVDLYRRAQYFSRPLDYLARRCGLPARLPQAM